MRKKDRYKADLLFYGSFFGFFRALWLGYTHVINILLQNCRNIEEHTKTTHNINYAPLEKFGREVVAGITTKNLNPVEELAETISDAETKALVKAMLVAVREEYSMGKILFQYIYDRIPVVWKFRSLLLSPYWIPVAR